MIGPRELMMQKAAEAAKQGILMARGAVYLFKKKRQEKKQAKSFEDLFPEGWDNER